MAEKQTEENTGDFDSISPTKIEINSRLDKSGSRESSSPPAALLSSRTVWAMFAILLIITLSVFVVLPNLVGKTEVNLSAGDNDTPRATSPPSVGSDVAPWQAAKLARQRKAAQDILEQLLDAQFELEELQVQVWASEQFDGAMELARTGDTQYREQEFEEALALYRQSWGAITSLIASVPNVIATNLSLGEQALIGGNAEEANKAFGLILEIEPKNEAALAGLERASVVQDVFQLLEAADQYEQAGNLDQTLETLDSALSLDAQMTAAISARGRVEEKVLERDFQRAMSRGLANLDKKQYTAARSQFNTALKLKPTSGEARDGLEQVSLAISQETINRLNKDAEIAISVELWAAAKSAYLGILNLDKSILFAQEGLKRTSNRTQLHEYLEKQLADTQRLTNPEVYAEAEALLRVARTVRSSGPILAKQVASLESALMQAKTPVAAVFVSDNQTDVTLHKVKHLGLFENIKLTLLPGEYIAVGKRVGYRDVRKEITIASGATPVIDIQCSEQI